MKRLVSVGLAALGAIGIGLVLPARPALAQPAHPLGNFSVNQAISLDLYPDKVAAAAIIDLAELPTLQERPSVDANGDGKVSAAESTAYNMRVCRAMAGAVALHAAGHLLHWRIRPAGFEYRPGSAGLHTSRISCALDAAADLTRPATIDITNGYRADRIGWREITATGHGVRIVNSPVPARSVSDSLRSYPADLLGSPLDQRSARLHVEPGNAPSAGSTIHLSSGDPVSRWVARADRMLERLVGGRLTPLVGALAVLLALVLGAAHAALPGHGKTVMAAYIAGRRGRPRDALTVGAIVTLTHTGGVLVLGLLLTTTASLAGEVALAWLGVASGVLVAAIGVAMLVGVVRRRAAADDPGHGHSHNHSHDHHPGHSHPHPSRQTRRLSLVGMGVAGGLVPSPSALILLLGAVGLGRTAFGLLLVVAYGVGMAATLTAAGLVLVRVRDRWAARPGRKVARLAALAPAGTATLILCVGLGLAARAALGLG
ncbi:MAG TPA: High-affinity nickel-transporter [Streptosporangiaceae bacterium]|nr:High-affinity nickel-transporter [Streptosporangiaceae bacterium]